MVHLGLLLGLAMWHIDCISRRSIVRSFHVLQLRKCIANERGVVSLDDIQVDEHLNYMKRPIAVLQRNVKVLQNKEVPLLRVQWEHRRGSK